MSTWSPRSRFPGRGGARGAPGFSPRGAPCPIPTDRASARRSRRCSNLLAARALASCRSGWSTSALRVPRSRRGSSGCWPKAGGAPRDGIPRETPAATPSGMMFPPALRATVDRGKVRRPEQTDLRRRAAMLSFPRSPRPSPLSRESRYFHSPYRREGAMRSAALRRASARSASDTSPRRSRSGSSCADSADIQPSAGMPPASHSHFAILAPVARMARVLLRVLMAECSLQ